MVIAAAIVSVLCLLLQDDSVPADSPVQDLPDEDYSDQAQVQPCEILQTQCPRLFGLCYSTFLFSMLFPTFSNDCCTHGFMEFAPYHMLVSTFGLKPALWMCEEGGRLRRRGGRRRRRRHTKIWQSQHTQ